MKPLGAMMLMNLMDDRKIGHLVRVCCCGPPRCHDGQSRVGSTSANQGHVNKDDIHIHRVARPRTLNGRIARLFLLLAEQCLWIATTIPREPV